MTIIVKNKLVRDLVPQNIKKNGQRAIVEILNEKRFYKELLKKMSEEVQEIIEASTEGKERLTEEISDLYEVIDALIKLRNISEKEIKHAQREKMSSNGSYNKRFYLVSVENNK